MIEVNNKRILHIVFAIAMVVSAIVMLVCIWDLLGLELSGEEASAVSPWNKTTTEYVLADDNTADVIEEKLRLDRLKDNAKGDMYVAENAADYQGGVNGTPEEETTDAEQEVTTEPAEEETVQGEIDKSATDQNVVNEIGKAASEKGKKKQNKDNKNKDKKSNSKTSNKSKTKKQETKTDNNTNNANNNTVTEKQTTKNTVNNSSEKKKDTDKSKNKSKKKKQNKKSNNPFVSVILADGQNTGRMASIIVLIISTLIFIGSAIGFKNTSKKAVSRGYSRTFGWMESLKLFVVSKIDFIRDKYARWLKGDDNIDKWKKKSLLSDDHWLDIKDEDAGGEKRKFLEDEQDRKESFLVEEPSVRNSFLAEVVETKNNSESKKKERKKKKSRDESAKATESFLADDTSSTSRSFLADDTSSTGRSFLADDTSSTDSSFLADDTSSTGRSFLADDTSSTDSSFLVDDTGKSKEGYVAQPEQEEDDIFIVENVRKNFTSAQKNEFYTDAGSKESFLVDDTNGLCFVEEEPQSADEDETEITRQKVESILAHMRGDVDSSVADSVAKADSLIARANKPEYTVNNESFLADDTDDRMIELVEEDLEDELKLSNRTKKMMKKKKKHRR
ncbi:MAG: hypothetical protein IKN54_08115 [Lachnospiraceae bacterium]|nr:hypothetical protein [Lachnospiraceae bacterium]